MSKANKYLIVIGGPTGSGKTKLAIELAQYFGCAIISADSRQFYRQMSIGTAKPTAEELAAAPHYFIDSLDIETDYSVGDFERDALHCLAELYQKNDYAILVGGSGLYHKAVCEGLDVFPDIAEAAKQKAEMLFETEGIEGLQKALQQLDPLYFSEVDIFNKQRLIRALSVCYSTGKAFSSFRNKEISPRFFQPVYFCTDIPRETLYNAINQRVDDMLKAGLEEEVKNLLPYKEKNALLTVGYKEFYDFWEGKYPSYEFTIEKIKQHSRNYAKRQITWFKHQGEYEFVNPTDFQKIIHKISSIS